MKKTILLLALALGISASTYAQKAPKKAKKEVKKEVAATPAVQGPSFEWDATNFDFGKIEQGKPQSHVFNFKNNGSEPIVITNAQASCGCTTPEWTKEPIAPGKSGFIKATYNAGSVGAFNKTVTVTANVPNSPVILTIKGEVLTKPAAPTVEQAK